MYTPIGTANFGCGKANHHLPVPQRNVTLPPSPSPRSLTPPPASAPPVPQPFRGHSTFVLHRDTPRRRTQTRPTGTQSAVSVGASSLQQEIDRLTAACEEHERKIRSSKASVEHRLFDEFPNLFSRLNNIDDDAEQVTAQLLSAIQSTRQPHKDRLEALISARKEDVDTMRERTTPWQSFLDGDHEIDGEGEDEKRGRIMRVEGAGTIDGADGLGRIERWAEEVELYLTSEIIRLKALISSLSWRRRLAQRLIASAGLVFILLVLIGVASKMWTGG